MLLLPDISTVVQPLMETRLARSLSTPTAAVLPVRPKQDQKPGPQLKLRFCWELWQGGKLAGTGWDRVPSHTLHSQQTLVYNMKSQATQDISSSEDPPAWPLAYKACHSHLLTQKGYILPASLAHLLVWQDVWRTQPFSLQQLPSCLAFSAQTMLPSSPSPRPHL